MDKQEIVFGIHPIIELLKAKRRKIYTIYTTKPEPKAWRDIQKLLPKYVNVEYVSKEKLNKISDSVDHQGIVALASPFIIRKKFFDPVREKFLVMLDSIQDPRNLGAILRSAYCTGAQGVIVTEKKSTFLTPTAIKASAGLAEHLEIYFAPNAKAAVDELKKAGYAIYISTLENSKSALEVDFKLPCCIVIGNEGEGVSQNILRSGQNIKLPQITADISYNASVAAGILLFLVATRNKII
jgi:23S rRNA (guanosine2251-2'-O)-methyltransferase